MTKKRLGYFAFSIGAIVIVSALVALPYVVIHSRESRMIDAGPIGALSCAVGLILLRAGNSLMK